MAENKSNDAVETVAVTEAAARTDRAEVGENGESARALGSGEVAAAAQREAAVSAQTTAAIVEFASVGKSFGDVRALQDISFSVFPGEVLAFLGPNGAGKSTTLKLLLGLRQPTTGKVKLFGDSPHSLTAKRRIGVTPQDLDFPGNLTVLEVLDLVCSTFGEKNCRALVERLELSEFAHRKTGGLSGGERRRLGLACALAGKPDLILLDEPTTGLDVESRHLLWKVIQEEQARGAAVLLTTHYLDEVEKLAHRVLVIDRGQKLFEGSVAQIKSRVDFHKIEFELAEGTPLVLDCVSIERSGNRVKVIAHDSDYTVRELVKKEIPFSYLQVSQASLEEAFLQFRREEEIVQRIKKPAQRLLHRLKERVGLVSVERHR